MSYQKNPVEVTPNFFETHAKVVTAIPPAEVPTTGGRGGLTKAKLNSSDQKLSRHIVFSDVDRFITKELKKIIEENNLFAFGYSYNCMNQSEHVRIIITNLRKIVLKWYSESNWAFLSISQPSPNSYVGMIEYSNCGKYRAYNYGDHSIVIPHPTDSKKDIYMFDCSRFMLVDKDVKVCEYNKEKDQRVAIPGMEFQIEDDRGLHLLAEELKSYIEHVKKSGSPLEGLAGESIFVTPESYISVTKDMLAGSGGYVNILPDYEKVGSDSYPKNWPIARIIKDISPFVPEVFSKYLKARGSKYLTFAIDNGGHPSMSTNIPSVSVVVAPLESVSVGITADYRVIVQAAEAKHGEVKFYRCPLLGGYSVYMKGKCLGHDFNGFYDVSKKGVEIGSDNGFTILECKMRRGDL